MNNQRQTKSTIINIQMLRDLKVVSLWLHWLSGKRQRANIEEWRLILVCRLIKPRRIVGILLIKCLIHRIRDLRFNGCLLLDLVLLRLILWSQKDRIWRLLKILFNFRLVLIILFILSRLSHFIDFWISCLMRVLYFFFIFCLSFYGCLSVYTNRNS